MIELHRSRLVHHWLRQFDGKSVNEAGCRIRARITGVARYCRSSLVRWGIMANHKRIRLHGQLQNPRPNVLSRLCRARHRPVRRAVGRRRRDSAWL